jgi:hypothetical protein
VVAGTDGYRPRLCLDRLHAERLTGRPRAAAHLRPRTEHSALLLTKLTVVAVSGATAYLHSHASTARARGLYGAATGLSAVLARLLGVLLHD